MIHGKEKGYEIHIHQETEYNILKFRLWGFWDAPIGKTFWAEFSKNVKEISGAGKRWYTIVDLRTFPPQTEDTQQVLANCMVLVKEHGVKKSARLIDGTITKMQFTRISKQVHAVEFDFFHSEEEAIQWLLSK